MSDDSLDRLRAADPLRGELPAPLERLPQFDRVPARHRRWRYSALMMANLVLLATVLLHALDHAWIQERGVGALSFEVMLSGSLIVAAAALSLAFTLRGDPRARLVALFVGPWIAAAVIVGHFLPYWGEFSDPYEDAGLEPVSYVLAVATAAAGVAVAAVAATSTPDRRALRT